MRALERKKQMTSLIQSKAPGIARYFLGVVFFIFGLNGFLQFMPMPPMPEEAGAFLGALAGAGYMFPLIKGTEVLAGVLLLSNRFVPLALALLAPITVNILLFHLILAPAPGLPLLLIAAQLYLAYSHRDVFVPMLRSRVVSVEGPSQQTSRLGAHATAEA